MPPEGAVDLHQFFTASRVLVVAGKGGVGKTTVSAVIARAAARTGLNVLVVDLEATTALPALLRVEGPFAYEGTPIPVGRTADQPSSGQLDSASVGTITGRTLSPSGALVEYLDEHGLRRISKRLVNTGIIDVVSTAAPGIDDILVLGKLKQIERNLGDIDLVVVDGPAAGHAITFLQSAKGLEDAVRGGPINAQARDVLHMLADPARCQVVLVTLPETTPVNELIETAYALEDRVGVQLTPVVVNAVDPAVERTPVDVATSVPTGAVGKALRAASAFRRERVAMHAEELARLREALPLGQLVLPLLATAGLTPDDIEDLADHLLTTLSNSGDT